MSIPQKTCSRCKQIYPATPEFFYKDKRSTDGLYCHCKTCHSYYKKRYVAQNYDEVRRQSDEYYERNKERLREYWTNYNRENRDRHNEQIRQNYHANIEYERERSRLYREQNPEKRRQITQAYYRRNKDQVSQRNSQYRKTNRHKVRIWEHRYEARKRNLPDTMTADDWQQALNYFNGCCAVCGRPLEGEQHTVAADHWIPLSSVDCPGTVPTNIVPLCHGVDGCNNSKNKRHPEEWLIDKFGEECAHEILSRILAYFDSLKSD